jgi:hypothetical protein
VRVAVVYLPDCPNWQEAGLRLRRALDELGQTGTPVSFVPVDAGTDAVAAGFAGSPTFTVDGADLFPAGTAPGALSCRVYHSAAGLAGVPEVTDLVAALRERTGR